MTLNESEGQAAVDARAGLFSTPVTLEIVENKVQEALNTTAKFGSNVSTEQFGFGQGFLSVMVRLKPDWQGEKVDSLPKSIVVKIPSVVTMELVGKQSNMEEKIKDMDTNFNMEESVKAFANILQSAHASEVSFYKMINKEGLNLNVPKCHLAENFGSNGENGLLIMEDLGAVGATKPVYEALSVESVKAVFDNLAEIHAYSLRNDQWLSNPDLKMTFGKFQKQTGNTFGSMLQGALALLKKEEPGIFDPLIDRLSGMAANLDFEYMDTLHEKLGYPPVLTHGDLWMNNVMWRKTEDGKGTTDELVAIVDWQLVHPGCIGEDFVRLLCSSAATEVRREHLDEVLQHYLDTLKAKLGKEPPFTVAQIKQAYKRLFRFGAAVVLPMFSGFVQAELGMLGIENVEQRRHDVLMRAKCLIEELYEFADELALEKA